MWCFFYGSGISDLFLWIAKKRLNQLFIKKLIVFPNFESLAFSLGKAFFEPK